MFEDVDGLAAVERFPPQSCMGRDALDALGVIDAVIPRSIMRVALTLSGFARFYRALPDLLETTLTLRNQDTNARAPTMAAALALAADPGVSSPIERAARLSSALLTLYEDILAGRFEPDYLSGVALESRGYLNLFGNHLRYEAGRFRWRKSTRSDSLLVAARGSFYIMDRLATPNNQRISQIGVAFTQLWKHSQHAGGADREGQIGIVGAASARTQALMFDEALTSECNRRSYHAATETVIAICLDLEVHPESDVEAARLALIGNPSNRWYPASTQLVIFGNGKAVLVCNFGAGLTGNIMVRAATELNRRAAQAARSEHGGARHTEVTFRRLPWRIAPTHIARAIDDIRSISNDRNPLFALQGIGREAADRRGLRPVELFAIAVRDACERLAGRSVTIHQFVSASRYRCGDVRTANLRGPCMSAAMAALRRDSETVIRFDTLLQNAIREQQQICRRVRATIDIRRALSLYKARHSGARKEIVDHLLRGVESYLRRRDWMHPKRAADVILSHPVLSSDVTVLGRPGVSLPYVECFAMHYQLFPRHTVVTISPGLRWTTPNEQLIEEIQRSHGAILMRYDENAT
jgi:hypothetical protein